MVTYSASNVLHGLDTSSIADLGEDQRKVLLRILARVAERSYRRGFQQGVAEVARGGVAPDLCDWRYFNSADVSPWIPTTYVGRAVDRLDTENHGLWRLFGSVGSPVEMDLDDAAGRAREYVKRINRAEALKDRFALSQAKQGLFAIGVEALEAGGNEQVKAVLKTVEEAYPEIAYAVHASWSTMGGAGAFM